MAAEHHAVKPTASKGRTAAVDDSAGGLSLIAGTATVKNMAKANNQSKHQ